MRNFLAFVVLLAFGAIFGLSAFLTVLVLGVVFWIVAYMIRGGGSSTSSKEVIPAFTGREHASNRVRPEALKPSPEQVKEYFSTVANLYACILCFYPSDGESKVSDIAELIRMDDWISDKFGALEMLATRLPTIQSERRDSPILFQLRRSGLAERVRRLPSPMRSRLAMQLDSLFCGLTVDDPSGSKDLIEMIRLALREVSTASSARLEAESFIMRSGNPQAITILQRMRRNPSQYKAMLRSGAADNTILKTALGVFSGILAAEAVRAAVTGSQMDSLLTNLDQDIERSGGLESLPLEDKELESMENFEFSGDSFATLSVGADADTWSGEYDILPQDQFGIEGVEEDAADLQVDIDNSSEVGVNYSDYGSDTPLTSDD